MELKRINDYWVDEHQNKWVIYNYTKEEAERLSKTLVYCFRCVNCAYCKECNDCYNCISCASCDSCTDCKYCVDCGRCIDCDNCKMCVRCDRSVSSTACTDCDHCHSCEDCDDCDTCRYCTKCNHCKHCYSCSNFDRDPQRIVGPIMGSRDDTPTVYWLNVGKEQCVVGCFRGDLNELEKKVKYTHKNNPKHLNDYLQWIEKVRKYMKG